MLGIWISNQPANQPGKIDNSNNIKILRVRIKSYSKHPLKFQSKNVNAKIKPIRIWECACTCLLRPLSAYYVFHVTFTGCFPKHIVFTLMSFIVHLVSGLETVMGKYGDTIEIPCNNGRVVEAEVTFVKWKYVSLRFTLFLSFKSCGV